MQRVYLEQDRNPDPRSLHRWTVTWRTMDPLLQHPSTIISQSFIHTVIMLIPSALLYNLSRFSDEELAYTILWPGDNNSITQWSVPLYTVPVAYSVRHCNAVGHSGCGDRNTLYCPPVHLALTTSTYWIESHMAVRTLVIQSRSHDNNVSEKKIRLDRMAIRKLQSSLLKSLIVLVESGVVSLDPVWHWLDGMWVSDTISVAHMKGQNRTEQNRIEHMF